MLFQSTNNGSPMSLINQSFLKKISKIWTILIYLRNLRVLNYQSLVRDGSNPAKCSLLAARRFLDGCVPLSKFFEEFTSPNPTYVDHRASRFWSYPKGIGVVPLFEQNTPYLGFSVDLLIALVFISLCSVFISLCSAFFSSFGVYLIWFCFSSSLHEFSLHKHPIFRIFSLFFSFEITQWLILSLLNREFLLPNAHKWLKQFESK